MATLSFHDLTAAEKEELSLCGITTEAQLKRCSTAVLQHDIDQLRNFFPDRAPALTPERVAALLPDDAEESSDSGEGITRASTISPTAQFKRKKNLREEIMQEREEAESKRRHKNEFRNLSPSEKLERMNGLSKHFHAIRCSHPMRVYFGAWATLLLIVPLFALLAIPTMLLTGDISDGKPIYYAIAFAMLVMPWLLIARRAECGVCHIPLYRFGNYPHNRNAHHLPLLGYTLTTALHIIFLFWFRCPACGTMMKLGGKSKRHHHHH